MATEKEQFVNDVYTFAQRAKELRDLGRKIDEMWVANGYASGGADELVLGDISSAFGCSVQDVTDMVTYVMHWDDFNNNVIVSAADRKVNLAKLLNAKL